MFVVVQTRAYGAHAPLEVRASYSCECCGHALHALAQAEGLGVSTAGFDMQGGVVEHQMAAQDMAQRNASSHLRRAFELAICPSCRMPPPAVSRDIQARIARWKTRRRVMLLAPVPIALAAVGAAAALGRYVAESSSHVVGVIALAVALPAATIAILSRPQPGVYAPNAQIFFWRTDVPPEPYRTQENHGQWVEATFAAVPPFGSNVTTIISGLVTGAALLTAWCAIVPG